MYNYIENAPFSLIISLILIFGNYCLGHLILKNKFIYSIISEISPIELQKILIGQIFLIIFLFPLIVFFKNANFFFTVFAIINLLSLLNFIYDTLRKKIIFNFKLINNYSHYYYLLFFLICFYFLLSGSPVTDADSLDYHFGSAFNIMKYNEYILHKEWITLAQSGSGEVLVAYGLFFKAEQYGSLVQFSGLLSICGILLKVSEEVKIFNSKYFLPIIILTSPVLLFLVSTAKPQLFFSACMFIAFAIVFSEYFLKNIFFSYSIINLLIFISISGKFSFNLSGFLIWLISSIRVINKDNFLKLIFITAVFCSVVYLPYIYWKWSQYGGNFFHYFFTPFPLHLPGYKDFFNNNLAPQGLGFKFPFFLILSPSLSTVTETLGFSSLIFFYYFFSKGNYKIFLIICTSLLFIFLANLFSSPSARYFFDVLLWLAFGLKYVSKLKYFKYLKFLNIFYFIQFFFIFFSLLYSTISFFPGSVSQQKYFDIKKQYANDYSGIKWVNEILQDKKVIIYSRSVAQSNNPISALFMNFFSSNDSIYYKDLIKNKRVNFFVTFGNAPELKFFKGCEINLYKSMSNVGKNAKRNPFAKTASYNAYIYFIDYSKLPICKP